MAALALLGGCGGESASSPGGDGAVATVQIEPDTATMTVGSSRTFTAALRSSAGTVLTDRAVTWTSSNVAAATVNASGSVTAIAPGTTTIGATSDGRTGVATITVIAQCSASRALRLDVGTVLRLTSDQAAALCVSGDVGAEYALVAFDHVLVDPAGVSIAVSGTGTTPISSNGAITALDAAGALFGGAGTRVGAMPRSVFGSSLAGGADVIEEGSAFAVANRPNITPTRAFAAQIAATRAQTIPVEGERHLINLPFYGPCNVYSGTPMRVVKVLPNTIVVTDTLLPAGSFTDEDFVRLATQFDTLSYPLDTLLFGRPTDLDRNGRIIVVFSKFLSSVGSMALMTTRDLISTCANGNNGELFYVPVLDPASPEPRIRSREWMMGQIPGMMVHELQHIIGHMRRNRVTIDGGLEEGLSHIAEEMLYYRVSERRSLGNNGRPFTSMLDSLRYVGHADILRELYTSYLQAPEFNSPFASEPNLATRGASWHLLRYLADRNRANDATIWRTLQASTGSFMATLQSTFGATVPDQLRDWAVSHLTDDLVPNVLPIYTSPSWNFRSLYGSLNAASAVSPSFPLATRMITSVPLTINLSGAGTAYVRFGVSTPGPATISAVTDALAAAKVDFVLVRTR